MSIDLLTRNASWQQIANVVLEISGECRAVPRYLSVEKPENPIFAVELELLFRNLGLEEQWAYIETVDGSHKESSRIVNVSDDSLSIAGSVEPTQGPVP